MRTPCLLTQSLAPLHSHTKKIKGPVLKTRVVVPYGFGAAESEYGVSLPELALVWLLIVKNLFLRLLKAFSRKCLENEVKTYKLGGFEFA